MSLTVDFTNKDVKRHIDKLLSLPKDDELSPHVTIPKDQFDLYLWAKAYEELEPIVSDHIYDMHTRYLERQQLMFPDIWKEVCLECFRDDSWRYTGMFIEAHDPDDELWLL
jgi:hypothetical protein